MSKIYSTISFKKEKIAFQVDASMDTMVNGDTLIGKRHIVRHVKLMKPMLSTAFSKFYEHAFIIYDRKKRKYIDNELSFDYAQVVRERARELDNEISELEAVTKEINHYVYG